MDTMFVNGSFFLIKSSDLIMEFSPKCTKLAMFSVESKISSVKKVPPVGIEPGILGPSDLLCFTLSCLPDRANLVSSN